MITNLLDRMKLPFRKNKEFLQALYDILGFYPHDISVYRVAFAHKSLAFQQREAKRTDAKGKARYPKKPRTPQENTETKPLNNERLEYLGDAVLETVVSDILFRHFPDKREGFLTSTRAKLVQRETLNELANKMHIDQLIQTAQGTRTYHTNISGNAFEALMGAIYLDRGFAHCKWFIEHRVFGNFIDVDSVAQKEVNFKSKLLEWSQKNRITLEFKDNNADGNERGFTTKVLLEGIHLGYGSGRSKKESQQRASKDALMNMRRDNKLYDSIFRAKEKRTAMEAEESFALPIIDEIEKVLNKGKKPANAEVPVLETKKDKKVDARSDADAAFDLAYDKDATFEVIDTVPEQPARTASDYKRLGIPAPPSENDLLEEENKAKANRRRTRSEQPAKPASDKKPKPARAASPDADLSTKEDGKTKADKNAEKPAVKASNKTDAPKAAPAEAQQPAANKETAKPQPKAKPATPAATDTKQPIVDEAKKLREEPLQVARAVFVPEAEVSAELEPVAPKRPNQAPKAKRPVESAAEATAQPTEPATTDGPQRVDEGFYIVEDIHAVSQSVEVEADEVLPHAEEPVALPEEVITAFAAMPAAAPKADESKAQTELPAATPAPKRTDKATVAPKAAALNALVEALSTAHEAAEAESAVAETPAADSETIDTKADNDEAEQAEPRATFTQPATRPIMRHLSIDEMVFGLDSDPSHPDATIAAADEADTDEWNDELSKPNRSRRNNNHNRRRRQSAKAEAKGERREAAQQADDKGNERRDQQAEGRTPKPQRKPRPEANGAATDAQAPKSAKRSRRSNGNRRRGGQPAGAPSAES